MPFTSLVGKKFGRLTVIERVENLNKRARYRCICDCGNEKIALAQNLLNSHVRSCGCFSAERRLQITKDNNLKRGREIHGDSKTRLYQIWEGIKVRCFKKENHAYHNYGGRGISMCEDWKNSYLSFKKWSLENGYSENLTIDRIDVNKDYCPENCRWVSWSVQSVNKRTLCRNSSGRTGVSWNKAQKKYVAYISRDGVRHHLGTFEKIEDAIAAREKAEKEFS